MRPKRNIAILAIAVLTALLVVNPWKRIAGGNDDDDYRCQPSGVYIGRMTTMIGEMTWTNIISAANPAATTATSVLHFLQTDATLGGLLPGAEYRSVLTGEQIRTGPHTWDYTLVGYIVGTDDSGQPNQILMILVDCGTATYSDDCSVVTYEDSMAFFLPHQDADGDGFPDEGEEPFVCVYDNTVTSKRVNVIPPYAPKPPPIP